MPPAHGVIRERGCPDDGVGEGSDGGSPDFGNVGELVTVVDGMEDGLAPESYGAEAVEVLASSRLNPGETTAGCALVGAGNGHKMASRKPLTRLPLRTHHASIRLEAGAPGSASFRTYTICPITLPSTKVRRSSRPRWG